MGSPETWVCPTILWAGEVEALMPPAGAALGEML